MTVPRVINNPITGAFPDWKNRPCWRGGKGLLLRSRDRQLKEEVGSLARLAFHPDAAVMLFDQRPADGHSQAGSFLGSLQLVEAVKYPFQLFVRNPGTLIVDRDAHRVVDVLDTNADCAFRGRVF